MDAGRKQVKILEREATLMLVVAKTLAVWRWTRAVMVGETESLSQKADRQGLTAD